MAKMMPSLNHEHVLVNQDAVQNDFEYKVLRDKAQVNVLDILFDDVTMKDMYYNIEKYLYTETKHNLFIATANPEIVHYAFENPQYHKIIQKADYIIPDGAGIIKASRILGKPLRKRLPGIELMETCLELANMKEKKVFLLGATSPIVEKAARKIKKKYPRLDIKTHHGFIDISDTNITEQIRAFNPDFIFVGMGYPKQEQWIQHHRHHFDHTLMMGVGGSIDVFSGEVKRAPYVYRALNLEWAYRCIKDVKRIHRIKRIPLFLWEVYKQKIKEH
ncbi:N-acetylglucosaminyldiphosphoundecaprenol N-acetyl-beta-D-mannosaminyltransferase TarA [Staphylococcus canis]|uniref:N-acetylglucosaminyldiphosphoundecaprenol N-acetyl-beta-D-mannosaminyltransferase n=1 Tax=Staphylococcus canis TaxID=2724942 RepID=A0ABS0T8U6_9STAP|nr:N-acetylglucosaminyldiphosphoundecaprenol N-acetyl-beta-D-mannosaminyltransferase TarA [Staphylococcus canis]MBI5975138.1 WecB/TagA/CpsF family glycosyltransferase [Staphylococcus canis]